ncbi:MAG: hypothetical protein R2757_10705 [Draconibacterium sp.]
MIRHFSMAMFCLFLLIKSYAQSQVKESKQILTGTDFHFLEQLTKGVLESSRIYPGQSISSDSELNQTGYVLIRPGGRDCYPSFWIRDYAMSLESGLIPVSEQLNLLHLTAATQCNGTWITRWGSVVPVGAIADHIRINDGLPVYFPGTYSYVDQGKPEWGTFPPLSDQYFFIHMAFNYVKSSQDTTILQTKFNGLSLIDKLVLAYNVPPTKRDGVIVYTTEQMRAVDFGFRDAVVITGDLCFPSILKYKASLELAWLFNKINKKVEAEKYLGIAALLKKKIPEIFYDERGMLLASTGKSRQADVWSTSLAVYYGILEGEQLEKTCRFLTKSYLSGNLSYKGNIRHVITTDDYSDSTAWEVSSAKLNTYQNGAFWGTPTGWVVYAIAKSNPDVARSLAKEYIDELKANDFRKGEKFGAPYECIQPTGEIQNPVYLTTVTCPYAVFKTIFYSK